MKQTSRSTAIRAPRLRRSWRQGRADVFKVREQTRRRRLWRLIVVLRLVDGYLWYRYLTDNPFKLPTLGPGCDHLRSRSS